ncbi:MAG: hydroxymyristoyl-ACP dehydratase [Paludibacteraceae bacterium]
MLFQGEEIKQLIPQREPIIMVDMFAPGEQDNEAAATGLTVAATNIFVQDDHLQEPGIIEHVAQSAAALAGYSTYQQGLPPQLGYIGEIKKFHIHRLPCVGDTLRTSLHVLGTAMGITLLAAEVRVADETVAEGQMKIFLKG